MARSALAEVAATRQTRPVKDRLTKERRSWNMSRIPGKNTTPSESVGAHLRSQSMKSRSKNSSQAAITSRAIDALLSAIVDDDRDKVASMVRREPVLATVFL